MKNLTILTIFVYTIFNSACAQTKMIENITFKSLTRGGQKMIVITDSTLQFTANGTTTEHTIDNADWQKLQSIIDTIKLEQMENYDAPSTGRASDAAWHSSLIVTTADGSEYSSTSFDNAKAPKELMELMQLLIEMDKKYNMDNQVIDY